MQKHPLCRGCFCVCSAVSYFSTQVGSIIGADRLSFRVRNGTGRFPVAVAAVTLFIFPFKCIDGGCGVRRDYKSRNEQWLRVVLVSFRPVSASSLHPLLGFQV